MQTSVYRNFFQDLVNNHIQNAKKKKHTIFSMKDLLEKWNEG